MKANRSEKVSFVRYCFSAPERLRTFLIDYPRVSDRQILLAKSDLPKIAKKAGGKDLLLAVAGIDHLACVSKEAEALSVQCEALRCLGELGKDIDSRAKGQVKEALVATFEGSPSWNFPLRLASANALVALNVFPDPATVNKYLVYRLVDVNEPRGLMSCGKDALGALGSYIEYADPVQLNFAALVLREVDGSDKGTAINLLLDIVRKYDDRERGLGGQRPMHVLDYLAVFHSLWKLDKEEGLMPLVVNPGEVYSPFAQRSAIYFLIDQVDQGPFIDKLAALAKSSTAEKQRLGSFLAALDAIHLGRMGGGF
jgi:hypothetical protein